MFYLSVSIGFILKMACIWLPYVIGVVLLLVFITSLKKDSNWLKRVIHNWYLTMLGEKIL
ncbi:hypothetical protein [Clostridium sp.]|uniref:hypothetical protein n=1 Tax=Clostridium sp. TaxID=1506 RepID=UPI001D9A002A|nr:hypothetical protein [Clostridium sp.]MBS5307719.1 hypothetical protein [Clostridium sp.]